MVFGTFDILHPGHIYYLTEAKKKGDELVVVLARDATVNKIKDNVTHDEETRYTELAKLKFINKVVLGYEGKDKLKVIEEEQPDIICLGYDQKHFTEKLSELLAKRGLTPEIIRLPPFKEHIYKSSLLRSNNADR